MNNGIKICVISPDNNLCSFLDKRGVVFDFYFDVSNLDKTQFFDYYIIATNNTLQVIRSINSEKSEFILFGKCCDDYVRIKDVIKHKIIGCIDDTQSGMQELLNLILSLNKTKKTITEASKKLNKILICS